MSARVLCLVSVVLLALAGLMVARRPAATPVAPPPVNAPQSATAATARGPARPRLPAPHLPKAAGSIEPAVEAPSTNVLARLLNGEGASN